MTNAVKSDHATYIWKVAGLVLVVLIAGTSIAKQLGWYRPGSKSKQSTFVVADQNTWKTTHIDEISFKSPFGYKIEPRLGNKMPAELQDIYESIDTYQNQEYAPDLGVALTRFKCKPDTTLDIDILAREGLDSLIKQYSDSSTKHEIKPMKIDGNDARLTTFNGTTANIRFVQRILIISDDAGVIWSIQTWAKEKTDPALAQKIFDSVHWAAKPTP